MDLSSSKLIPFCKYPQQHVNRFLADDTLPEIVWIIPLENLVDGDSSNIVIYHYINVASPDNTIFWGGLFVDNLFMNSSGVITNSGRASVTVQSPLTLTDPVTYDLATPNTLKLLIGNSSAEPLRIDLTSVIQLISVSPSLP